jgi:tripartite-type tricarboxylate transporter receptor subunit TctC
MLYARIPEEIAMLRTTRFLIACIAGFISLAMMSTLGSAFAETFPTKPVRIIVGAGVGSVSDVRTRWVAQRMGAVLGQPVVVENKAGAIVAPEYVAKAAADGYTLLVVHMGTIVSPVVYPNAGFDPLADFTPISRISKGYGVLTVNPEVPARSVQELIALARAKPGKLNYGSTGIGGPPWMAGELFKREAGIEVTHIAYKGGGELLQDLIGGRIDYWLEGALIQMPHVKAGRLRALAVTAPERLPFLPDVPTLREAGLTEFQFEGWTGIVAPRGTPRPVIDRLNAAMRTVLASPEAVAWLADQANEPAAEAPEEFAAFMKAEQARWLPIVKDAGAASRM